MRHNERAGLRVRNENHLIINTIQFIFFNTFFFFVYNVSRRLLRLHYPSRRNCIFFKLVDATSFDSLDIHINILYLKVVCMLIRNLNPYDSTNRHQILHIYMYLSRVRNNFEQIWSRRRM